MKTILFLLGFFICCVPMKSAAQWLFAQDAVFVSTVGKVTVADKKGMARSAAKGSEVFEGERVTAAEACGAVLRFFDGSTVELRSNTQLIVSSLKHPGDQQKEIRFELMAGWALAKVQKLMTVSSLFEIEAGGVVCGVRGPSFQCLMSRPGKALI